jgi:small subunit ribosomal protein S5
VSKPAHKGRNPMKEVKEFEEEVIEIDRVTRVVKGGRRMRFRATVAIGDKKGRVGIGIGKANEVTAAIQKAITQAKKSIIRVPIFNNTIPHDIKIKHKSAKIIMMPAGPGTGIIAGGPVRKLVDLAGIKNILSKCLGSSNRVTNTQAAFMALGLLRARTAPTPKAPAPAAQKPKDATAAAPAKKAEEAKPVK